mmetsp:Transcript_21059/g.36218  ORF Transcript_21059/g.36218 Transcript_21059/m.36218 type:complete len:222 (+) Transcript_21059:580-1245(+)
MLALILLHEGIAPETRDSKHTKMVFITGRSNEIRLTQVRIITLLLCLLSKHAKLVKGFTGFAVFFTGIDENIFPFIRTICRKQPNNALQIHAFVGNNLLHQLLRISKQFLCFTSDSFVIEDFRVTTVWVAASELPCLEERIPVNIWHNIFKLYIINHSDTKLLWGWCRGSGVKINDQFLFLRLVKGKEVSVFQTSIVVLSHLIILFHNISSVLFLQITKQR